MAQRSTDRKQNREPLEGLEIFEITPVIVGGSPTDPENKTALTRDQHIQACRYWNKIVKELRDQQPSTSA